MSLGVHLRLMSPNVLLYALCALLFALCVCELTACFTIYALLHTVCAYLSALRPRYSLLKKPLPIWLTSGAVNVSSEGHCSLMGQELGGHKMEKRGDPHNITMIWQLDPELDRIQPARHTFLPIASI